MALPIRKQIKLMRDCEAVQIPSGELMSLHSGSEVVVTQSLGGSFTVLTDQGYMVRIASKDADALGEEFVKEVENSKNPNFEVTFKNVEEKVWEELKSCYDPEIPVNIVDLGLIYSCQIQPVDTTDPTLAKEFKVDVTMTLTAPGCGMGQVLKDDIEQKMLNIPGVKTAAIEVVFDPPWDRDMMSEAAKLQLGFF